jgi:hypothetical protein
MKRGGKRSRLVGAGVAGTKGGDACVALGGGGRRSGEEDEGDASVPRPYWSEAAPQEQPQNTYPCKTLLANETENGIGLDDRQNHAHWRAC